MKFFSDFAVINFHPIGIPIGYLFLDQLAYLTAGCCGLRCRRSCCCSKKSIITEFKLKGYLLLDVVEVLVLAVVVEVLVPE